MVTTLDELPQDGKLAQSEPKEKQDVAKKLDSLPDDEVLANLDRQIAILRHQLERLEYLRYALEDPGTRQRLGLAMTHTWDEVLQGYGIDLGEGANDAPPTPRRVPTGGGTRFDRIAVYFRTNGNEWATSGEIQRETRVKQSVLRDILYKTHKDRFDRKDNPDGRGKLFRLKDGKTKK